MQLRSPIFILGCHKSGTSLVRSLLDGHPEIDFVYPNELHYFRLAGYRMKYALGRRFRRPSDFSEFAARARTLIEPAVKGDLAFAPFGPHATLDEFRFDVFLQSMLTEPAPAGPRDALLRYLEAAAAALGCRLEEFERPVRVVEKSVSNVEFAAALRRFFPDCHLIHVLRNPYANMVAIRRSKRGPASIGSLRSSVKAIRLSFDEALQNLNDLPGFHVVRYEDFLKDPEAMARDLCERLGIGYSPSMLVPTVLGRPWGGNSSSRADFGSTISQRPLHEWKSHVLSIEIDLVNRHLEDVMTAMGYDSLRPRRHWLLPARHEGLSAYVLNRTYLRFGKERNR